MIGTAAGTPADNYSPQRRTALLLTGTGTAGAYHAGVLRALHEAGVKVDVVAARGIGVVGALFAAIDGGSRLWEPHGFWRGREVASFYAWRPILRLGAGAIAASALLVVLPVAALAAGLVVFPVDFVLKMLGSGAPGLVGRYLMLVQRAFAPEALPTWLPRLVVLVLGSACGVAVSSRVRRSGARRRRGPFWWRIVPAPLSTAAVVDCCWRVMWNLVRGAAQVKQPAARELARRYTELLGDNLGQPGFRELVVAVHDLDARRDLVFAMVSQPRRRDLITRPTSEAAEARRAEVFDLSGVARDYLADAVSAALALPLAAEPHPLTFAADAYWRGETHRLCDRPESLARLLEELANLGVEQVIVASAASESQGPHELAAPRVDGRGRLGEYVQSSETAAVRDHTRLAAGPGAQLFTIRPAHNPVGPFDFGGSFDDRSDRRLPLVELMNRGYEDAYRQFIEPIVGASGDRMMALGPSRGGRAS